MTFEPSEDSDQPSLISLRYALNRKLRVQAFFMQTAKIDQAGRMPRSIWVFTEHTGDFVGFVVRQLRWSLGPHLSNIDNSFLDFIQERVSDAIKRRERLLTEKIFYLPCQRWVLTVT